MDAERAKLIQVAGLLHPEFYESLDRYQPLSDLLNQVEQVLPAGWRVMRSGLWHQVQAPAAQVPVQGWKIHLSATYANLEAILQIVLTVCLDHHVPFKFACDKRMFLLINRKFWGRGASGKFITIYPKDEAQFRLLLDELYTRLKGFEGPYILSDRRYKDCKVLYYRYGGLKGLMRTNYQGVSEAVLLTPEGQEIPDAREPQFTVPPWVADPFPEEEAADDTELLNGRYAIQNALHFSNSGGVYEALDVTTGEVVVIKEARPHTNSDEHGNDQIKLMQKEWRLLNRLKETGITPRPIDLFWEWEHLFLVESFAKGVPARRYAAQNSAILKLNATQNDMHEYLRSVEIVGIKVARALQTMHDHGIIFGDVSLANIMINPEDLAVTLIDLEGACEVGVDEDTCLYTPGFTTRDRASRFAPTFEDDDYALGSVLLGLLMPIQVLKELKPDAHQVFLTEIQKDFGLSAELAAVIRGLLNEEASTRMRLPDVIALLDKTQIQAKMPAAPVTFTTESVQQTLRGVGEYMLSAADLKRTNRPFPVDPGNRLPLELGHGALGVIYALHRLHGEVPGEIMDWLLRQEFQPDRYPAGLYTGLSGVAWVLAELGQIDRALDAHRMAANHMHLFTAADLFNGTSGFGLGSLHLWQRTGRQQFLDQALRVGDYLLSTRREDHRGSYWPSPDGKIPVGYAYGASGIALFLLYLYLASGEERFVRVGRAALDFDLSCRVVESGLATFPELAENSTLLLPYWRAGSAGVATTMLRYMQVAGNEDLLTIFDQVLPDACRKYTVSPGLFTGLSGLGNLLLDCHQVTGDTRYLREAHRTAEGILLYKLERPSGVAFPGDHLYRISVDYGHGSAGVGLFLHRLLHGGPNFNLLLDSLIPARVPAHV